MVKKHRQTGGGWWIHKIAIITYIVVIIAFAVQTLELVSWLFPDDNQFMRVVTVFVADGCATGWAMAEMFYQFRLRRSRHLAFGMWIVTFILSTFATAIQMYLSSTHNIPHKIDPNVITVAYGMVILAFVVNIIAITVIIRMEHEAGQPIRFYMDDEDSDNVPVLQSPVRVTQEPVAQIARQGKTYSEAEVRQMMIAASGDRIVDKYEVKPEVDAEKKKMEKPKSFGHLLGDVHAAFHGAIDSRLDRRQDPINTQVQWDGDKQEPTTTTVFVPARDDKPITEEKPGHDPRTRRLGGNEEFEAQEDNENPS